MSTSITTISSDHTKPYKNSFHLRNNSGELDVFEAARYFKEDHDTPSNYINSSNIMTRNLNSIKAYDHRHHQQQRAQRPGRMSLDMPKRSPSNLFISPHDLYNSVDLNQKQAGAKDQIKKLHKQPSSPGAKLASFLNSLFNQTTVKKAKTKKKKNNNDLDENAQIPAGGWRRKRRSSISHFSTATTKDHSTINAGDSNSKSMKVSLLSSVSGIKAPQFYNNTPTKSYKEYMEELLLSDRTKQQHVVPFSDSSSYGALEQKKHDSEKRDKDRAWNLGDNSRFRDWIDERLDLNSGNINGDDDRDGAESDSSSDLFDLPNIHEFDYYSSGLPVYETTHVDRIKTIAASLSSITTV